MSSPSFSHRFVFRSLFVKYNHQVFGLCHRTAHCTQFAAARQSLCSQTQSGPVPERKTLGLQSFPTAPSYVVRVNHAFSTWKLGDGVLATLCPHAAANVDSECASIDGEKPKSDQTDDMFLDCEDEGEAHSQAPFRLAIWAMDGPNNFNPQGLPDLQMADEALHPGQCRMDLLEVEYGLMPQIPKQQHCINAESSVNSNAISNDREAQVVRRADGEQESETLLIPNLAVGLAESSGSVVILGNITRSSSSAPITSIPAVAAGKSYLSHTLAWTRQSNKNADKSKRNPIQGQVTDALMALSNHGKLKNAYELLESICDDSIDPSRRLLISNTSSVRLYENSNDSPQSGIAHDHPLDVLLLTSSSGAQTAVVLAQSFISGIPATQVCCFSNREHRSLVYASRVMGMANQCMWSQSPDGSGFWLAARHPSPTGGIMADCYQASDLFSGVTKAYSCTIGQQPMERLAGIRAIDSSKALVLLHVEHQISSLDVRLVSNGESGKSASSKGTMNTALLLNGALQKIIIHYDFGRNDCQVQLGKKLCDVENIASDNIELQFSKELVALKTNPKEICVWNLNDTLN